MGILKNLEGKLENLVEGIFSRTFKSQVQPVEIARKLAKEMEEHKTVSISRTYVPNEYTVFLSREDYGEVESYGAALGEELATYLLEHARREGLTLLTRPAISFESDQALRLGEFGIQTRLVKPPSEEAKPEQGDFGRTMVYTSDSRPEPQAPSKDAPLIVRRAVLLIGGKRFPIDSSGAVIGRSRECEVAIDDTNVSRRHAEITADGSHWYIADLESLNGVVVNGRRVESTRLSPGDELMLGTTRITFDLD